jgi:transketolase
MVSVAAGLAQRGFRPWIYSITPFLTLRPYEQLRNDVCLHGLPVRLAGNGGGYGYGIMGSTHHALEDIGAMRLLPDMGVYVPCYASDISLVVEEMNALPGPAYLRLNQALPGPAPEPFSPWRRLAAGNKGVIVSTGPVVRGLLESLSHYPAGAWEIVAVGKFPIGEIPEWLVERVQATGLLVTLEEHVAPGGLGETLASALWNRVTRSVRMHHLTAIRYPSGRYGSQRWHQEESGLAGPMLQAKLTDFLGENSAR